MFTQTVPSQAFGKETEIGNGMWKGHMPRFTDSEREAEIQYSGLEASSLGNAPGIKLHNGIDITKHFQTLVKM